MIVYPVIKRRRKENKTPAVRFTVSFAYNKNFDGKILKFRGSVVSSITRALSGGYCLHFAIAGDPLHFALLYVRGNAVLEQEQ